MDHRTTNQNLKNIFFACVYLILLLIALYHLVFARRIIPGVEINNLNVGGMTYTQARKELLQRTEEEQKEFLFRYNDEQFEFNASDLEVVYNIDATIIRAFEIGRTGNVYIDTKDKIAGLLKPLRLKSFYSYNSNSLNSVLSYIESRVSQNPENAYYYLENGELKAMPAKKGKRLDSDALYRQIINSLDQLVFSESSVVVNDIDPYVTDEVLENHREEMQNLVFNPVFIHHKSRSWELSEEEVLSFIRISADDNKTYLALNEPAFEAFAENLAAEVNVLPRGQVTREENGEVLEFSITQEGQELDVDQFGRDFKESVFNGKAVVDLSMNTISGPGNPERYGIVALLGEGVSEYTGSAPSRVQNLTLAAERTNGVLVPPGEIYSFNTSVGDISAATGYASAYIISNGRTVLGDGGGVCQTSTTLFRAVLNSGLPVVKRNPHAYRVRYYELDAPLGMDASIYQPYLDFQFKNDTNAYVLVQSAADLENNRLYFKLYGTPDGREVEISDSIVTGESPPPEPLYQDDPDMPEGQIKQVDFAAWGATASFDRVVRRNGDVLYEDTFTTRYQPWRAIYLVGTKKD